MALWWPPSCCLTDHIDLIKIYGFMVLVLGKQWENILLFVRHISPTFQILVCPQSSFGAHHICICITLKVWNCTTVHHAPLHGLGKFTKVMNCAFPSRHTVKSGGEGFFRCPSQIQEFYIHLKNLITYNLGRFSVYSKSGWVRRLQGLQTYQSLGRINSESSACGCSFPPTHPGCSIVEGLSAADVWV